jgi:tetratricopeptide (TPR) repeat protein
MRKLTSYLVFTLSLGIVVLFLMNCSTEKDALLNRTFHNVTAKYNGYFNANEIIIESLFQHEASRKENYYNIIPVYQYPNTDESKGFYAPMDTAAAKCEIVIGRHSMPAKKVGRNSNAEWCSWIDDNWITIGWSQFYKRDYESAMEKFEYIEKQYKKNSIVHTAKFWEAKTLLEIEDYFTAEEILLELIDKKKEIEELEEEEKNKLQELNVYIKEKLNFKRKKKRKSDDDTKIVSFPKGLENKIYPTLADLYIRTKEYDKAIDMLNKAISLKQKREFRTRLIFILAQVYHELKNNAASELYGEVVKRNPDYEMAFQAKINRALAFSGSDNKSIKNQLLKMLKDDKNIDYYDQIYFALAEIALKEQDRLKGIEYLELSIESSSSNAFQKTASLMRLAELYYLERNYRKANQYFEATMGVIPKEHEDYELIKAKNKNLADLIRELNVIEYTDSILNLCKMPEKEVLALINDIIDTKREEIEAKKDQKELDMLFAENRKLPAGSPGINKLFIWDQNLKGLGFNEFKQIWGDVKLEDNWRRFNKNVSSMDLDNGTTNDSLISKELTIDYYLDQLPCGDQEELLLLEGNLMTSLYESGNIYLHKLDDAEESIGMYERVSKEYLPHEKAIAGLYQLYIIYKDKNKFAESNLYKNTILKDYKNSEYAQLILNPNYKEGQRLILQKEAIEYASTYELYSDKDYQSVIKITDEILALDSLNTFYCKYSYLNALSLGKLSYDTTYKKRFEKALSQTVRNCKESEYYQPAKTLLDKIRNVNSIENAKDGKSVFIYNNSVSHKFILFFPKESGNINSLKNKLSNFNKASFSKSALKTSNSFLNSQDQLIIVQEFDDLIAAMDYYSALSLNKGALKDVFNNFECFIISEKNLSALYIGKDLPKYMTFFNANYLD